MNENKMVKSAIPDSFILLL